MLDPKAKTGIDCDYDYSLRAKTFRHARDVPKGVEREAVDTVIWTVPTSIAGVLALLEFRSEAGDLDDDQTDAILYSVADALRDLHPNVTVTA